MLEILKLTFEFIKCLNYRIYFVYIVKLFWDKVKKMLSKYSIFQLIMRLWELDGENYRRKDFMRENFALEKIRRGSPVWIARSWKNRGDKEDGDDWKGKEKGFHGDVVRRVRVGEHSSVSE